jgi:membrane-bound ClpP family serine protease
MDFLIVVYACVGGLMLVLGQSGPAYGARKSAPITWLALILILFATALFVAKVYVEGLL